MPPPPAIPHGRVVFRASFLCENDRPSCIRETSGSTVCARGTAARGVWCHGVCRIITRMLQRRGVLELFHEEDEAYVKTLSANNWGAVALSKAKFVQVRGGMLRHSPNLSAMPPRDVLVLFHAVDSRDSMAFTPYFKKMARQFKSLNLPSLVVARYDVSDVSPPRDVRLTCVVCAVWRMAFTVCCVATRQVSIDRLPTLVFIPAFNKQPPFKCETIPPCAMFLAMRDSPMCASLCVCDCWTCAGTILAWRRSGP